MKILTQHKNINNIIDYLKFGGYNALKKALKTMSPKDIREEVKKSKLRGRGGAGFPTYLKWEFITKSNNENKYFICNADESEPGTFKDREIMIHNPHMLIEGIILSSYALNINTAYIYVRGEFFYIIKKLKIAINEAYCNNFLGNKILNTDYHLNIYVHPGAGAYICGEETALIESLEGKRGNPRIKPPFPAQEGLWGYPTIINNVETIANIYWIVVNGGSEYAKIGTNASTGTKLISACGHINNPGVYEIELGLPVEEFIYSEKYCGGILNNKKLKAVIPGGTSVPILPYNLILNTYHGNKRLFTYESMAEGGLQYGSMIGSGGFIVMDEDTCIVNNTLNLIRFYKHESCGQCSPCREGTMWMENILKNLKNGNNNSNTINLLLNIADNIEGNTICPFGDAAAAPVISAIRHFRKEFENKCKNK